MISFSESCTQAWRKYSNIFLAPFLQFSSFVRVQICTSTTRTLSLSLSSLNKDDLHVLHGVAEQQRSIEDGVICDSHEIVSEIFERLDHGCVVVLSRVVKLNSLLPASAAAPKIKLNCAKRRSFFSFLCVLSRPMASSHSLKFSTIENIKALLLILFSLLYIKQAFEVTKTIKRIS